MSDFLLTKALSAIAMQGKPVELDHDQADWMGAYDDPAMQTDALSSVTAADLELISAEGV